MVFSLIAYEMCSNFKNDYTVTSYISFLGSLIKEANDVTELRKAGIIKNFLTTGSDQEVAQLFKEIRTELVPNPKIYARVSIDIQKYYESKLSRICQFLYHNYRNPLWTVIGILISVMALVFTAIQTWSPGGNRP